MGPWKGGVHTVTAFEVGGPVPPDLSALVAHVAAPLGPTAALIETQLAAASVVAGSPTMVDVEVPPTVQRVPLPDGPIPVRAIVYDEAGRPEGEVLVWLRFGMLIGVEQAWFTDDPPSGWPAPGNVRLS